MFISREEVGWRFQRCQWPTPISQLLAVVVKSPSRFGAIGCDDVQS